MAAKNINYLISMQEGITTNLTNLEVRLNELIKNEKVTEVKINSLKENLDNLRTRYDDNFKNLLNMGSDEERINFHSLQQKFENEYWVVLFKLLDVIVPTGPTSAVTQTSGKRQLEAPHLSLSPPKSSIPPIQDEMNKGAPMFPSNLNYIASLDTSRENSTQILFLKSDKQDETLPILTNRDGLLETAPALVTSSENWYLNGETNTMKVDSYLNFRSESDERVIKALNECHLFRIEVLTVTLSHYPLFSTKVEIRERPLYDKDRFTKGQGQTSFPLNSSNFRSLKPRSPNKSKRPLVIPLDAPSHMWFGREDNFQLQSDKNKIPLTLSLTFIKVITFASRANLKKHKRFYLPCPGRLKQRVSTPSH
jgi:hypothetical protein